MRLLVIAPHYNYFIKDQIEALSRYVDEITVFVKYNPLVELFSHIPFWEYSFHLRNYTYKKIINLGGTPDNILVYPVRIVYFKPDGRNQKLGELLAKKINELIRKEKIQFDLIHAHFTWPSGYAAVKLGEKFGVPVVVTVHEDREWIKREYNSGDERIISTWQMASALIRVNRVDVPLLLEFNDKVCYIPNGFNPNKFRVMKKEVARKKLRLPDDINVLFNLAGLYPYKGHIYLIRGMKTVVEKRDDVLCFIGGAGPLRNKLQQQINEFGLQDHVKLLGFVSDEELEYWMNAADIFVLPSLSEGNPTVMFEALGVGLPFVGTTVGGVPEIITSEDYGLLCPPADPECLAEKILIALDKEWDRERIREYAKQFTWENIAKRTLGIYRQVLSKEARNHER